MGLFGKSKEEKLKDQQMLERVRSNKLDSKIFNDFIEEWQEWCETGKEPKIADNDLRYSLNLQEKRLKKHGLAKKVIIDELEDGPIEIARVAPEKAYVRGTHYIQGRLSTSYIKKDTGEVVGKRRRPAIFYETIVKAPENHEGVANIRYSCPNCGGVSKVPELLDGCPYCNTKFTMSDLYPKVHNAYTLRFFSSEKQIRSDLLKFMVSVGLLFAIFSGIMDFGKYTSGEMSLIEYLITLVFGSVIFGVIAGYILWAFYTLGTMFFEAGKSLPLLFGTLGGKKKIKDSVSSISEDLGYEYFEGKALSLLRGVVFSDNPNDFVQYSGRDLPEDYKDIVDISYRGGIGVKDTRTISVDNKEKVQLTLRVYVENARFDGNSIRMTNDTAYMTMVHDKRSRVNRKFSITAVTCPNCGGSFNATKERNCTFCNSPFNAEVEDWVVTGLEIRA